MSESLSKIKLLSLLSYIKGWMFSPAAKNKKKILTILIII